jgi:carboxypeptidase C (cathepsin A)
MPDKEAAKAETPKGEEDKKEDKKEETPPPPDRESVSEHRVTIGDNRIDYRAVAGSYTLKEDDGKAKATFFYIAYTRQGIPDLGRRPITFAFNGGPGSASLWLHMGIFGPRRIDLGDAVTPPAPPYRVIDNSHSLLDVTDLVFIDPISTGYSRAVAGEDPKQFHGVTEDVQTVAEFIRLHTTRALRWESPKFVAGESYGTTRAAALSGHLLDRHGLYLNGVMLISAILMFQTALPNAGNDLPYVLALPTMAATAWYHERLGSQFKSLRALTDEVEEFALNDYAQVLLRGSRATDRERATVAGRLSRYTGISRDFIERANLRITPQRFFKQLLRDQRRTVGRLDTRFTGIDPDAEGEQPSYDPALAMIMGPYTAAANHYLRADLRYESDLVYEPLNDKVRPWNYGEAGTNRYLDVASTLRDALSKNRSMRVFLGSGYYDLATPFAAAEWTLDHMGLDPSLRDNLTMKRYEAGHMMYIHEPSMRQMRADLVEFVQASTPES